MKTGGRFLEDNNSSTVKIRIFSHKINLYHAIAYSIGTDRHTYIVDVYSMLSGGDNIITNNKRWGMDGGR